MSYNGLSMPNGRPNAMEPMVHLFNDSMPGTLNGARMLNGASCLSSDHTAGDLLTTCFRREGSD